VATSLPPEKMTATFRPTRSDTIAGIRSSPPPGEAGRPRDRAALAAMNKCLAGAHSEFFEPPHRYERLLMVLRRSIHLTLAHGNAWSACRSECLVITKVGRHIRCVEDRDIGVILFPE
jgi:hypothetical protein